MTDTISVDKKIPVIPRAGSSIYPYSEMDVNDSFFVANGVMQTLANLNWRKGKVMGKKFIARKVEGGVRIWRIA